MAVFGNKMLPFGGAVVDDRFIFSVKTDNAGTSGTNQFTIPTTGTGYLYDIETSDGQIILGNTGNKTITFPSAGTYTIYISGNFPQNYFNNTGDKLKILNLSNLGIYGLGSADQTRAFNGCSNMIISATDSGHFGSVTDFQSAFQGCSSLTSFPFIDTSSGTNFNGCWNGCNSLLSFPLLDTSNGIDFTACWILCSSLTSFPLLNTSSGTTFTQTWAFCSLLNSFPLLDVSSGTIFQQTWLNCSSLTSFPLLDTSSGTNFSSCWSNTSVNIFPANFFDSNIATNYSVAFLSTNLSQTSIDNILVSLDVNGLSGGTFRQSGGSAPSITGTNAIDSLRAKSWTIIVTGGY